MSALIRDAGMSTRVCLAVTELRIRVSMSAIGSVISLSTLIAWVAWCDAPAEGRVRRHAHAAAATFLPTALRHARDVAFQRQLAEAQAAQGKLAHVGARTAAEVAAVAQPDLELRRLVFFRDLGGSGQHLQLWRNGMT